MLSNYLFEDIYQKSVHYSLSTNHFFYSGPIEFSHDYMIIDTIPYIVVWSFQYLLRFW